MRQTICNRCKQLIPNNTPEELLKIDREDDIELCVACAKLFWLFMKAPARRIKIIMKHFVPEIELIIIGEGNLTVKPTPLGELEVERIL